MPGQLFGSESTGAVPTIEEASQPAKGGKDLLRMFKELRQSVSNEWIGSSRGVGGEEDKVFLEKKEKVFELERLLVEGSSKVQICEIPVFLVIFLLLILNLNFSLKI